MKFRTQFNPDYKGTSNFEPHSDQKITVPDLNMSIATLLEKHSRGINLATTTKQPQYYGDLEVPKINDLNDVAENAQKLKNRQMDLEELIAQELDQKKQSSQDSEPPTPPEPNPKTPEPNPAK